MIASPFLWVQKKKDIVIAGKLGSEPEILIQMYKQLIEQDTDLHVQLKPGLENSICIWSVEIREVDIYPEFSGTALSTFVKEEPKSTNRDEVYEQARIGMEKKYNMIMLKPMEYNNTYALAMPKNSRSKEYKYNFWFRECCTGSQSRIYIEFADREDGYKGMQNYITISSRMLKRWSRSCVIAQLNLEMLT